MNPRRGGIEILWVAVLILSGSFSCRAEGFSFEVAAPKFRVSIPGIPQMKMSPHPDSASRPHLRYLGSEQPYTIAISTPAAAAGMTPLECAGAITRSLADRRSTPPPSQVFKGRLNERTFVAIYAAPVGVATQLHAHLLSAAGGTHCIEVHATKVSIEDDDLAAWITDLEKAGIEAD